MPSHPAFGITFLRSSIASLRLLRNPIFGSSPNFNRLAAAGSPIALTAVSRENLSALRAALGDRVIQFVALSLQPNSPYGAMRRMALRIAPLRTLLYNENLDHFTLRPRSWPAVIRYIRWKTREHITWQIHPGGDLYTFLWRLRHPREFRRPLAYRAALKSGRVTADRKAELAHLTATDLGPAQPAGISVVIPSRNGRDLLAVLLPVLEHMLKGRTAEIIVVDNGSSDETADSLRNEHPKVRSHVNAEPLSFARAVNRGIAMASYSHVLLLNNDMRPHDGFLEPLIEAFSFDSRTVLRHSADLLSGRSAPGGNRQGCVRW